MFCREKPAKSICDLVDYLLQEDAQGSFVYRGQVREYPGPLLPSLYRHHDRTGRTYGVDDPECQHSLRKSGRSFVDLFPISGWFSTQALNPVVESPELKLVSRQALDLLLTDPVADSAAISGNLSEYFSDRLHLHDKGTLEMLDESMKYIAEDTHRRYIRDVLFSLPLGTLLGTTIAQQYGFSSGYLDVTTSIVVAAFFATHQAKAYFPVSESSAPGIIYRFAREATPVWSKKEAMRRRFATLPPSAVIKDLAAPFEGANPDYSDGIRKYVEYALDALNSGGPVGEEYFTLPRGWLKFSRLGRQETALLIPDRIVEPFSETPEPVWWQHQDPVVADRFAVEDLASRPQVEKYYFRHSESAARSLGIRREYLWARDADFFRN